MGQDSRSVFQYLKDAGYNRITPVQNGTVEAGQTAAYYYFGKHPNFVFETGLPPAPYPPS